VSTLEVRFSDQTECAILTSPGHAVFVSSITSFGLKDPWQILRFYISSLLLCCLLTKLIVPEFTGILLKWFGRNNL